MNWLVAGGQLSFRLGCICMNYINRSHGAGLDPGCPINSIHHAEISGNFIMISIMSGVELYKSHICIRVHKIVRLCFDLSILHVLDYGFRRRVTRHLPSHARNYRDVTVVMQI